MNVMLLIVGIWNRAGVVSDWVPSAISAIPVMALRMGLCRLLAYFKKTNEEASLLDH